MDTKNLGQNPKDLMGIRKPPISLIPPAFLLHVADAMRYGAHEAPKADGTFGYGPYNWRDNAVVARIYIDAAMRHLLAFLDGEECAPDSGAHHLAHAAACCGILLDAMETGNMIDNRPKAGPAPDIAKRLTKSDQPATAQKPAFTPEEIAYLHARVHASGVVQVSEQAIKEKPTMFGVHPERLAQKKPVPIPVQAGDQISVECDDTGKPVRCVLRRYDDTGMYDERVTPYSEADAAADKDDFYRYVGLKYGIGL